jgi:NADH-quinone oxidoreductase subunit M
VAFGAATGVILSAGYALWLYRRVVLGDLIKESPEDHPGHGPAREGALRAAGDRDDPARVYPALVLDVIGPSVQRRCSTQYETALAAAATTLALN